MKPTRLIALVLAVQLLAASGDAAAVVLCLGVDGHATVEVANGAQRCDDSLEAVPAPSELLQWTTAEDCGACEDVGLLARSAALTASSGKSKVTAPSALSNLPAFSALRANLFVVATSSPVDTPVAVSLRTIVLLV
jgi:hypothetical protein